MRFEVRGSREEVRKRLGGIPLPFNLALRTSNLLVLFFLIGAASAQESLPPGPGQQLVLDACVQCHDLRAITSQRKTEAAWRRTVNEMIWRGAPLMPGEAETLARYLASLANEHPLPPGEGGRRPGEGLLPPGPGRALVLGACVQCHDLAVTVTQKKTPEAWRRSVEQMAHLGARLNGREIQIVAKYLAQAFH